MCDQPRISFVYERRKVIDCRLHLHQEPYPFGALLLSPRLKDDYQLVGLLRKRRHAKPDIEYELDCSEIAGSGQDWRMDERGEVEACCRRPSRFRAPETFPWSRLQKIRAGSTLRNTLSARLRQSRSTRIKHVFQLA